MEDFKHFISDVRFWTQANGDLRFASCQFNKDAYHARFFQQFEIEFTLSISKSVKKRQAEYLAGRYLAKELLTQEAVKSLETLGAPSFNIPVGKNRSPIWPKGIIGSITHNQNIAICAIASTASVSMLGIDIETILEADTAKEIGEQVHQTEELIPLTEKGWGAPEATTAIFSAKESIFKALHAKVVEYFGFEVCRLVEVEPENDILTFEMEPEFAQLHGLGAHYQVRFQRREDTIFTWLSV